MESSNVSDFLTRKCELISKVGKLAGGGGPPHNGDMEARVLKLETLTEAIRDRLAGVESRLTVIERTMATKEDLTGEIGSLRADLHKEINAQTWKLVTYVTSLFVTVGTALVAATYFIATHVQ
ncbi:hypothetical protein [Chromobacterium haemolyticum]|uniref:hypothetical protein n=1 Tax=Chromobacterium haemolyticum TaxID=394935 RepID=UPI00307F4ABB